MIESFAKYDTGGQMKMLAHKMSLDAQKKTSKQKRTKRTDRLFPMGVGRKRARSKSNRLVNLREGALEVRNKGVAEVVPKTLEQKIALKITVLFCACEEI